MNDQPTWYELILGIIFWIIVGWLLWNHGAAILDGILKFFIVILSLMR